MARAEHLAEAAGRPVERPGRANWIRRYWPALMCVAVILSQTRTWTPTVLTLGAGAALAAARWLGLRLPGVANHMVVGVVITLILVYELVAGSSGGTWSVPDAVQLALIVGMLVASTRSLGRRPMRFVLIAVIAAGVLAVQVGTGEQASAGTTGAVCS